MATRLMIWAQLKKVTIMAKQLDVEDNFLLEEEGWAGRRPQPHRHRLVAGTRT